MGTALLKSLRQGLEGDNISVLYKEDTKSIKGLKSVHLPHVPPWARHRRVCIKEGLLRFSQTSQEWNFSWLSRIKSQEDKEHRIAVRGFVSLQRRKPDLPPFGGSEGSPFLWRALP